MNLKTLFFDIVGIDLKKGEAYLVPERKKIMAKKMKMAAMPAVKGKKAPMKAEKPAKKKK